MLMVVLLWLTCLVAWYLVVKAISSFVRDLCVKFRLGCYVLLCAIAIEF